MNGGLGGSWRLAEPADAPFLYRLVAAVEPRWWRFSRHGIAPAHVVATIEHVQAGAVVMDDEGRPVGMAALSEGQGASGTATLDIHALPDPTSEAIVASFAPELLAAAFTGAAIRRLYHERFDDDPDLLGATSTLWEREVHLPEFASIDSTLVGRSTFVLPFTRWERWERERTGGTGIEGDVEVPAT